ncbi:MAG: hypothetical protein C4523_17560 [Myxococcales bacterium]|nr:MAG: hypothetical protein C4523_17560 [Myxococcales bacterium]
MARPATMLAFLLAVMPPLAAWPQDSLLSDGAAVAADSTLPAFTFTPGAWARYEIKDKAKNTVRELKIGVAHAETTPAEGVWIELETTSETETPVIVSALVRLKEGEPRLALRVLVKIGNYPPIEMDPAKLANHAPDAEPGTFEAAGEENLETAGEAFRAQKGRWTSEDGSAQDLWLAAQTPIFGLVRAKSNAQELTLIDFGRDYQPQIVEEPIRIEPRSHEKPASKKK